MRANASALRLAEARDIKQESQQRFGDTLFLRSGTPSKVFEEAHRRIGWGALDRRGATPARVHSTASMHAVGELD